MSGGRLAVPLSAAYGAAVALRGMLYRRGWLRAERAPVPVISVGNIVAGGTGKTPMVAMTARLLRDAGLQPVVVSRGYGGRRREDPLVVAGLRGPVQGVTAAQAGDEPVMLSSLIAGVPVVVSRRRSSGAALAITRFGARSIVLDDGFQHLALARDLDLVLLDARRPLGNGRLLPAGLLRESPGALARADALFLSGQAETMEGGDGDLRRWIRPEAPIFHLRFAPTLLVDADGRSRPLGALRGARVVAFAGIARPGRLRRSLESLGADVARFLPFADHHVFAGAEIRRILAALEERSPAMLVTTEKDLARLRGTAEGARLLGAGPLALRIEGSLPESELPAFRELLVSAAGPSGPGGRR